MVKVFGCIFVFLFLFYSHVSMASPSVEASVDVSTGVPAHFPIVGTITITHAKNEKVDLQSFMMESKALDVSFVKDVDLSISDSLLSIYSFQLPGRDKGIYVLPSISVKIDGQTYHTIASSYVVNERKKETKSSSSTSEDALSTTPPIFRLEAEVVGPKTLHPGERTKLLYRISYNQNVDLTKSEFPMIHPKDFQKVGDVQIKDYQEKDATIQDLTQEIQATEPGVFQLGPSFIEGLTYTMKAGQKVYDTTLLRAEALAVTIRVDPFPESVQPPSFTGALGRIQAQSSLKTTGPITIGENITVYIEIEGIKNGSEFRFPYVQCQPGFSGFFQTSDLPPSSKGREKGELFLLELRPLTSLVQEVPSIELSSFDAAENKYVVVKTKPIPFTIDPKSVRVKTPPLTLPIFVPLRFSGNWPTPERSPLAITTPFEPLRVVNHMKNGWNLSVWMIPLALALLILQKYWKNKWDNIPPPPRSRELFQQAMKSDLSLAHNVKILEQAFWHRLWEQGVLPQRTYTYSLDTLKGSEELEKLRVFLEHLQALQYSANKNYRPADIKARAKSLFSNLRKNTGF